MKNVDGWVATVTGAASGMGLAMATTFARAGMKVMMADIEEARLRSAAANLAAEGHDIGSLRTDVSKLEDNQALAKATVDRFGKVNVFCANAGIGMSNPVWATTMEEWRWTLDVDLWGPIYGVTTFTPLIQDAGEGHLNATASMAGLLAGASLGAYNVAKHGVVALMASLARDLMVAKSPITASVLCPGPINTDIIHSDRNRPADVTGAATPAGAAVLVHAHQGAVPRHGPCRGRPDGPRRHSERPVLGVHPPSDARDRRGPTRPGPHRPGHNQVLTSARAGLGELPHFKPEFDTPPPEIVRWRPGPSLVLLVSRHRRGWTDAHHRRSIPT